MSNAGVGVLSGRALAAVLLGWNLVKVIVKLLFTRETRGLAQFRDNYGSEGLTPITGKQREALARFSRCIACGRCDVGEAQRIITSRGQYPGLMQLVLASTRSMPDYDAAQQGFAHVPDSVLHDKVGCCPVALPFFELAEFVRAKAPAAPATPPQLLGNDAN